MSTVDPPRSPAVADCTHGADCPVHAGAAGVHNFDPACGRPTVHTPHRVAIVDGDALTIRGLMAIDVPVYSMGRCGGGLDPADVSDAARALAGREMNVPDVERLSCGRLDAHEAHSGWKRPGFAVPVDPDGPGVLVPELVPIRCPGSVVL